MRNYIHNIESGLLNEKYFVGQSGKSFASPMKELNKKTSLIENNTENKSILDLKA